MLQRLRSRDWFHSHHLGIRKINVITENVHARRTRLLFQEALGPDVAVGVIAVMNPDYDSHRWWRYSQGVKDVVSEGYRIRLFEVLLLAKRDSVTSQKSEIRVDN